MISILLLLRRNSTKFYKFCINIGILGKILSPRLRVIIDFSCKLIGCNYFSFLDSIYGSKPRRKLILIC
jgi:hypothetical protein